MATPIIGLTELESSTNNKFTVHNRALAEIEAYGIASVISTRTTVPSTPAIGDFYLIYPSTSAPDWLGKSENLTTWNGTGWEFFEPVKGLTITDLSTGRELIYTGDTWLPIESGIPTYTDGSDVTLTRLSAKVQIVNPNGSTRNVALPSSPGAFNSFTVVNDSDNMAVLGNTVLVRASNGGTILFTLDDTTGLRSVKLIWVDSESKWVVM